MKVLLLKLDPKLMPKPLSRYDITRDYAENYARSPEPVDMPAALVEGNWCLAGIELASPLGIAAGPLLNGDWCNYYARRGFDLVTYKTVRSRARECYGLPNLQPVVSPIDVGIPKASMYGHAFECASSMEKTWAVSFGMPSMDPSVWRDDIRSTRDGLPRQVKLSVSIVGSMKTGWTIEQLAEDYACCAKWAVESGADIVEANFSCPNVDTCDGQLYQNPFHAAMVANHIRTAIKAHPLLIKIGYVPDESGAEELVEALAPNVDGLVMTNSIAGHVINADGSKMFNGQPRGICGQLIRQASIEQVQRFRLAINRTEHALDIVGVGGIFDADDVRAYLHAGACSVQLATAVMLNQDVGIDIRRGLAN